MVVLIVDDQISVVSGIYFGVDWKKIGVTSVLKTYNAQEAKKILQTQIVDIVLCDIEMPVENGLSLLHWVREAQLPSEFIFLTSHADFLYATEAMKLNSFDYILQPARYEDIEKSIVLAIKKIETGREANKLLHYGKLLYEEKQKVLQVMLREKLSEPEFNADSLQQYFKSFDINITAKSQIRLAMIHLLDTGIPNDWDENLLLFGINNVLAEIFEPYGQSILCFPWSETKIIALIYPCGAICSDDQTINRILNYLKDILMQYFELNIACYFSELLQLNSLSKQLKSLNKYAENNVAQRSHVSLLKGIETKEFSGELQNELFENMDYISTKESINSFRNKLKNASDRLDANSLKQFYNSFVHIISNIAHSNSLTLNTIFDTPELIEFYLNAYSSVSQMNRLIDFVDTFFENHNRAMYESKTQIENIKNYIRKNITEDIRRSDIAEAVYLSPNYISRLFKNEMNISLKDFIVEEKMKVARSLIASTNLPISVVASKVGYSNFSHFSQTYKNLFGYSPTAERNKPSM